MSVISIWPFTISFILATIFLTFSWWSLSSFFLFNFNLSTPRVRRLVTVDPLSDFLEGQGSYTTWCARCPEVVRYSIFMHPYTIQSSASISPYLSRRTSYRLSTPPPTCSTLTVTPGDDLDKIPIWTANSPNSSKKIFASVFQNHPLSSKYSNFRFVITRNFDWKKNFWFQMYNFSRIAQCARNFLPLHSGISYFICTKKNLHGGKISAQPNPPP